MKADVETQGDFVQSLAAEVRAASFTSVEDLVAFVNWLDEELSFLVCSFYIHNMNFTTVKNSFYFLMERHLEKYLCLRLSHN